MSIYGLKPRFQALLRPLVKRAYEAGITANQVTVAACVVSVALGVAVAIQPESLGLFLLIPGLVLRAHGLQRIDGMLAREFGQASRLGAYLNELTDVVSDVALYLPFAFVAGSSPGLLVLVAGLAIVSELAGVLGIVVGASRRYDGPMGKSDRAFVFGLLGLLVGLGVPLADHWPWILGAVAALIAITIANRVRAGLVEAAA
jgi:CDP-diacylglycerol--glycerol-3-phosphate 3-phosphatidyltransferase